MKVEKSGKSGPITIILNGNGEPELFWHLFNISENRLKEAYFERENHIESARESFELLEKNGMQYWQLFDQICRPKDCERH